MPRLLHASHSHLFVGARLWPDAGADAVGGSPGGADAASAEARTDAAGSEAQGDAVGASPSNSSGDDRVVFSDGSSAEATLHSALQSADGKTQRLDVASYETQAGTAVAAKSWFCDERADAASGSTVLLVTERAG